jgi:hypothetical protein
MSHGVVAGESSRQANAFRRLTSENGDQVDVRVEVNDALAHVGPASSRRASAASTRSASSRAC